MDDSLWKANLSRYHEVLGKFTPEVVARACEGAWKAHPDFFPGVGRLVELCAIQEKAVTASQAGRLLPEASFVESDKSKEVREAALKQVMGSIGRMS